MTTTGNSWVTGHSPPQRFPEIRAKGWAHPGSRKGGGRGCPVSGHLCHVSQARSPSCRPHPPAGDEVGGDDFTLGENHVSAVQEGEGRVVPCGPTWLVPLCLAKFSLRVPAPLAFTPCSSWRLLPDSRLCLRPAESSRGIWHGWPDGVPWPHPQVKMQCRKGIPSALRARCWPLLCGAHMCQKNIYNL